MRHFELFSDGNGNIFHHWTMLVGKFRKARIDVPIENIALQRIDHDLSGMNSHRLFEAAKKVVDKNGKTGDVVHVWMSNNDIAYLLTLRISESNGHAAGIEGYAVINQVARETLIGGRLALAIEGAR